MPAPEHHTGKPAHQLGEKHLAVLLLPERARLADHVVGEQMTVEPEPVFGLSQAPVDAPDERIGAAPVQQLAHIEAVGRIPPLHVPHLVAVEPERAFLRDALAVDQKLAAAVFIIAFVACRHPERAPVPRNAAFARIFRRFVPAARHLHRAP